MALTRDAFFAHKVQVTQREVDGLGSVHLRAVPYAAYMEFMDQWRRDEEGRAELGLLFACYSLCDESGGPLFSGEEEVTAAIEHIRSNYSVATVRSLSTAALSVNGLGTDDEVKDEVGNSEEAPSDD